MQKYGLNSQEVEVARQKYGKNILPEPPRHSFGAMLWENLQDPMIKILLVALAINVVFVYSGQGDWL